MTGPTSNAGSASGEGPLKRPVSRLAWSSALAIGIGIASTACGGNTEDPKIQLKPNASVRYEITVNVEDLPGRFDTVAAFANYKVTNEACVPMTPVSGVKRAPIKRIDLDLLTVDEHTFKAEVFVDRLLDEDYFGRGVCHWSLVAATFTGTRGKTQFHSPLAQIPLTDQTTQTRFYSKKLLDGALDTVNPGLPEASSYGGPADTFRILMSSKGKQK